MPSSFLGTSVTSPSSCGHSTPLTGDEGGSFNFLTFLIVVIRSTSLSMLFVETRATAGTLRGFPPSASCKPFIDAEAGRRAVLCLGANVFNYLSDGLGGQVTGPVE